MGIFVDYNSNVFKDIANIPTKLVTADTNTIWVTSLIVCNRIKSPMRFNLQKTRISGLFLEKSCDVATTANFNVIYNNGYSGIGATITNNDVLTQFSVDGLTPAINSRILIKDQTDPAQNGIYVLTNVGSNLIPWVLTRSIDFNSPSNINNGDIISVTGGTTNSGTKWRQTSNIITVGTTPIIFIVEAVSNIFIVNELEIDPYASMNIIDITGVINLEFSTSPFVSDGLICFSNGYSQIFDCDINYAKLNELPLT